METEKNIKDNRSSALKQALERRQTEELASNFSYRMMERVRLEAEKQKKRRASIVWVALLVSVLSLLGLGVYALVFYLNFSFADYLPQMNYICQDTTLLIFYLYIALLVLVLLGIDYWLRKKYFWK